MKIIRSTLCRHLVSAAVLALLAAAPASSDPSTRRERADAKVRQLVQAIDRGDVALLYPGSPLAEKERASAQEGLEGWRHFLGGKPVARIDFLGESGNPGASSLEYRLVSAAGRGKMVTLSYNGQVDELYLHDEFLDIYPRATLMVREVIATLESGDAPKLARLLTPDDEPFPVERAERMIARYRREIDPGTLAFRFQGVENTLADIPGQEHNDFLYLLEGKKDGRAVQHAVRVGHGDGLVFWIDPFIPQ